MITIEYRIYSRATKGGGAYIKSSTIQSKSTKAGGGVVKSSGAGGGTTVTSSSGGGQTSSSAINWMDGMSAVFTGTQIEDATDGTHFHLIPGIPNLANHNHTVSNHTHSISLNPHVHEINLSPHQHDFEVEIPAINIPAHTHEVEHGIFQLDRMPTKVTIKVDGNVVPHTALSGESLDLIPYLELDDQNRVKRGWHTVEITPNDLARINAQVMTQFFIQSRGGVDA